MIHDLQPRPWMSWLLLAAGLYNLVWGFAAVVFPTASLQYAGFDPLPTYPQLWQCIGMIVGVYGIGYWIAAFDPYRHWPIVLVGLLGKIFGPIGYLAGALDGSVPAGLGWTLLTNDLIWWLPFAAILWGALRHHQALGTSHADLEYDDPIRELISNTGQTLDELSTEQPQLVVLLRHAGCTFCRETVAMISQQRQQIQDAGCGLVFVHPGAEKPSRELLEKHNLAQVPRISDPECRLYRQFGLDLGGFRQLFGLRVWIRAFVSGVLSGHGFGRTQRNSFQMPGAFVLHRGRFIRGFRSEAASDRPDFVALARSVSETRELV